jgi:hypothetical protein
VLLSHASHAGSTRGISQAPATVALGQCWTILGFCEPVDDNLKFSVVFGTWQTAAHSATSESPFMNLSEGMHYEPETIALLRAVLDEVWDSLSVEAQASISKTGLAQRILREAAEGERDPLARKSRISARV